MSLVHFYIWIVRIGIAVAICGQLKTCTLIMMHEAAEKTEAGVVSHSKFSRLLTR